MRNFSPYYVMEYTQQTTFEVDNSTKTLYKDALITNGRRKHNHRRKEDLYKTAIYNAAVSNSPRSQSPQPQSPQPQSPQPQSPRSQIATDTEIKIRNSAIKIISTDNESKYIMLENYRAVAQESKDARAVADTADKMYMESIKNSHQYAINGARDYARAANKYAIIIDMKVLNMYKHYTKLCGSSVAVQRPNMISR